MTPPPAAPRLTWSLVVATYARHEMLARSVSLAARQTRPPAEVVVVDGSPDWQAGEALVRGALADAGYGGRLAYQPARTLGLPAQRNQANALAGGDVLFLMDDDSLLYPDAAERVMAAYEADAEGRVVGVGLVHADEPPPGAALPAGAAPTVEGGRRARARRALTRLSWRGTGFFLPYDAEFPAHPLPAACAALGARPAPVLDGFRMTFRRWVCGRLQFEEMLRRYAVSEDQDFSYRASRLGALAELPGARVHHVGAGGGRLPRRTVVTLHWCNQVALRAVHGTGRGRAGLRLAAVLPFRLGVYLLQDALDADAGLPRTRGTLSAIPWCVRFLALPAPRVRAAHAAMQARLLGPDPGPGGRA